MSAFPDRVIIRNARQHNLKGITVELPRRALTVITGPSGSGKSSLAFDTLYAEGQRRYIESLSTYAKQFLERMPKPLVDAIEGISPAVAIEQKNPTTSSRSTVGTATEIYDFLRLLWARTGTQHCVKCGSVVKVDTVQEVVDALIADCRLRICRMRALTNPQSAIHNPLLLSRSRCPRARTGRTSTWRPSCGRLASCGPSSTACWSGSTPPTPSSGCARRGRSSWSWTAWQLPMRPGGDSPTPSPPPSTRARA